MLADNGHDIQHGMSAMDRKQTSASPAHLSQALLAASSTAAACHLEGLVCVEIKRHSGVREEEM